jgi:hypothetical protein
VILRVIRLPRRSIVTLTTDRVRLQLQATRLTAAVSGAPSGSNFNIGNLPGLFTANGITLIQVQTSSKTNFENASDLSGFVDGTSVSVRGLLSAAPRLRYSSRTKLGSAEPQKVVTRCLSSTVGRAQTNFFNDGQSYRWVCNPSLDPEE